MKPLGTITMYYPFVDKKISSEIEDIMDEAENYYDFVIRLTDRACLDDTPSHLAYLAAVHAWKLSATVAKTKLLEKFGDHNLIKSWTASQYQVGVDAILQCIEEAIEETKEDWLRIELLCLKVWYARYHIGGEDILYEPLERAESILENQSELNCLG